MLMNTIFKNIKALVNSSTIKFNYMASKYETLESIENADAFIAASQKTDRFDMYTDFAIEAIINSKITNNLQLQVQYASNPKTIPTQFRDIVLDNQRKYIIDSYVEINNYYRMLHGLPNIEADESEFFKLTEEQMIEYNIINDGYIHELPDYDIYKLIENGYLDKLINDNPDKKYLNYLGNNKIDIVIARTSTNFSILKINAKDIPDDFYNTFIQTYEQNREYFMTVLYINNYSNSYDMYDNFIGLSIMFMTIQRVISNTFKFGINKEFFDWDFIQKMYASYNVPFVETVGMEYHIILLKNLNNLLRHKSTDKVLFDIATLLGYDRLKIFKYYLVKEHKLDQNEDPVFYYKQDTDEFGNLVYNEDGSPKQVLDFEKMYNIYFQKVELREKNTALALEDLNNRLDYNEVILNDPYWLEDEALKKIKYENVYNYVETKYISLTIMYKITEMLFEISYAFRMIIDKKDEISNYTISLPKVYPQADFNIFDIVIFTIALLCKKHGYKDGLITTPSKISHVYGFNFNEENINKIKSIILNNPKIIDQSLIDYFNNLTINSAEDANNLFYIIREYNDIIIEKMRMSNSIEEYHLYKDIFTISIVSEVQEDMFTITVREGNDIVTRTAKTYLEYLEYTQPILAQVIKSTDREKISSIIDHIIAQLTAFMDNLQYLYILNEDENPILTAIIKLINFFKSYTVDLAGFNILYIFDSKYYQLIKLIDEINHIHGDIIADDSYNQLYSDELQALSADLGINKDMLKQYDMYKLLSLITIGNEYDNMYTCYDKIGHKITNIDIDDSIDVDYLDSINSSYITLNSSDAFFSRDCIKISYDD